MEQGTHGLAVGMRVRSRKTNYLPFTGTVRHVWTDLVKVEFDTAQGPHVFTVTQGTSLEVITEGGVHFTGHGMLSNAVAPLPPHAPEELPAIVYPLDATD